LKNAGAIQVMRGWRSKIRRLNHEKLQDMREEASLDGLKLKDRIAFREKLASCNKIGILKQNTHTPLYPT